MNARDVLNQKLATLLGIHERIAGHAGEPLEKDWEEQALQLENVGIRDAVGEHNRAEVEAVRAALKRLDDGTYGVCVVCEGRIEPRRLEAMPTATTCRDCAETEQ